MAPRHRLIVACALLAASMLPLLVRPHWRGLRAAELEVFLVAFCTCGLALWGTFAGRVAWVLMLLRAVLQAAAMLFILASVEGYKSHADFLRLQAGVSLALTVAALVLLSTRVVRSLVWHPVEEVSLPVPRPPSRLATRGVLGGFGTTAVLLGSIEQAWIYQHLSLLELVLRSLYLVLPWAGAWQLAKLGRDRVLLTMLGALLGELGAEAVSLVASGAEPLAVVSHLLLPFANLPVLLVGLALAIWGPHRPLWQLGLALPLAQLGYRAAVVAITTEGGKLSWQAAVLAVLTGLCFACSVYMFRRQDEDEPPTPVLTPPGAPAAA